jgi:hypothetical protein
LSSAVSRPSRGFGALVSPLKRRDDALKIGPAAA